MPPLHPLLLHTLLHTLLYTLLHTLLHTLLAGALNAMMRAYTELVGETRGYLTDKGSIDMARFERFVGMISTGEGYTVRKKMGRDASAPAPNARESEAPGEYKRRYYLQKLGLHPTDSAGRRRLIGSYLQGLTWCLEYYHNGCRSWDWFYPDFYAPLASDLVQLPSFDVSLEMGAPRPSPPPPAADHDP